MTKKNNKQLLPKKHNAEDTIFNHCVTSIEEFPQYITQYDDIIRKAHTKILSEAYQNLNLDSVFERKNGALINIEHHSSLTKEKLARDNQYLTTLYSATLRQTEQFIMYTGELPIPKALYLNYRDVYSPNFFISKQIDGEVRLNNLKYKIENNKKITTFDVLDLIWIPTFKIEINKEDLIVELTYIYNELVIPYSLSQVVKKCLVLWAGKYVENEEKIKIVMENLKMSAIYLKPFEEQIKDAIIDGKLTRAEERGKEIGREEGKEIGEIKGQEKIIKKLLKKYDAEKVSEITEIEIEKIEKIKVKLEAK